MKRIIEETENQGLESLLGEKVMIFCVNYIYAGTLMGVNDTCIELTNAQIVYETGPLTAASGYKDAQSLPGAKWFVQLSAIESFGLGK